MSSARQSWFQRFRAWLRDEEGDEPPPVSQQASFPQYPVHPPQRPQPYWTGDGLLTWKQVHHPPRSQAARTQPLATRLVDLPPEQQQAIFSRLSRQTLERLPKSILERVPTAQELNTEELPPEQRGLLPMEEVHRRLSAPKLQSIPLPQVSRPLWVDNLARQQSSYLLRSDMGPTEEESRPDLSEPDEDATESLKAEYRGAPTLRKLLKESE